MGFKPSCFHQIQTQTRMKDIKEEHEGNREIEKERGRKKKKSEKDKQRKIEKNRNSFFWVQAQLLFPAKWSDSDIDKHDLDFNECQMCLSFSSSFFI